MTDKTEYQTLKFRASAGLIRGAMACQATKDVRYYLQGVAFASNRDVVGTDGTCLFTGTDTTEQPEGYHWPFKQEPGPVILRIDGKIPASAEWVDFEGTAEPNTTGLCRTDNGKVFTFTVVDGHYPDYPHVIPTLPRTDHATGLCVDPALLARALGAFGGGKGRNTPRVALHPGAANDALLCVCESHTDTTMVSSRVVVMPLRGESEFEPLYTHAQHAEASK